MPGRKIRGRDEPVRDIGVDAGTPGRGRRASAAGPGRARRADSPAAPSSRGPGGARRGDVLRRGSPPGRLGADNDLRGAGSAGEQGGDAGEAVQLPLPATPGESAVEWVTASPGTISGDSRAPAGRGRRRVFRGTSMCPLPHSPVRRENQGKSAPETDSWTAGAGVTKHGAQP